MIWSHRGQRRLSADVHTQAKTCRAASWAIIWFIELVRISRNVQRAIVSVSPFHDFVSWLIQSRLVRFPAGRKHFPQRQLFSRDHGCSPVEHKRQLRPCCPLCCPSLPQPGCLLPVLEFALLFSFHLLGDLRYPKSTTGNGLAEI